MKKSSKLSLSALKENAESVLNKEELISIKGGLYCSGYGEKAASCYGYNNILYAEICVSEYHCYDERSLIIDCNNAAGHPGSDLYTYHALCRY